MNHKKLFLKINQDVAFSNFMMRGKKSRSIFFPGCAFMKFGNEMIYNTLKLLKIEDEDIEVCSICCSNPSQVLDEKYHKKNKEKLIKFLRERDVKKIYVACPNCYKMLNIIKSEYNQDFSVIMIYKIILEKLSYINKYHPIDNEVVIHDPCAIRDEEETQNAIREILKNINQKYIETKNNKNKTICCGNINMTHILNEKLAKKICKNRVDELTYKSDTIMSYCNGCLNAFKKCNIKTIHIMELIFGKVKNDSYYKRISFTRGLKKC